MNNPQGVEMIDTENALKFEGDKAIFKRTQHIDNKLLSNLSDQRFESSHERMGNFHKVASIPTVIVEQWMAEGFNIFDKNVTTKDILKRLQREDMGGLMATSKTI
jgi:hypothetical protein